jgi:hypothetical protein
MRWVESGVIYSVPVEFLANSPPKSTPRVGMYSGGTADSAPAPVDGRFREGNPYRWPKGTSGNARGRPRRPTEMQFWERMLDLTAQVHDVQRRLLPQRDSRFQRFRVFYEYTGNAYRSALLAGYGLKTAKSKAYLLARRGGAGMGDARVGNATGH